MPGNKLEQILEETSSLVSKQVIAEIFTLPSTVYFHLKRDDNMNVFLCPPYLLVIISGKCDLKGSKWTRGFHILNNKTLGWPGLGRMRSNCLMSMRFSFWGDEMFWYYREVVVAQH